MTRSHASDLPSGSLVQPQGTAGQLGYRMPAEWEPCDRVWLTQPHNPETWPGCLELAHQQFADLMRLMRPHVEPCTTQSLAIPTDDSWIRDYGPLFVVHDDGRLACHQFVFNCWGGKYAPFDQDAVVPGRIAQHLAIPMWNHEMVLEGGSIDVNGVGTVMTTRQCLLDNFRNPHLTQQDIEQHLHEALGTHHTIWLPGGITGDDTDGHIDDVARFINTDTIAAVRAPQGHPDHAVLERNWRVLKEARDQNNTKLNLVTLPVPDPLYYQYPPDDHGPGGRRQLPASYANFLIANRAVLVPVFGQRHDDVALRRLEDAMPGVDMIGVRAEHLVVGLGAIHCLTMSQPRVARDTSSGHHRTPVFTIKEPGPTSTGPTGGV